jgi:putative nucleotidyltransferase with HDIG domain
MNERERVAWILRDIRTLPTLPHVAMQLLRQSESADTSMRDIAALVERDPAVATRLLKLVNSPFFGIQREIASVHQALLLVGLNNLRSLVLSTSVMDLFDRQGKVGQLDRADLWRHCIATAITARTVAERTRAMDPEIAFTAGLVHDIGKVIIDRYLHAEFAKIVTHMEQNKCSMRDAEFAVLSVTHTEIGLHLSMHWNLPEVLRECIAYHHDPEEGVLHSGEAALIAFANELAHSLGHGYGDHHAPQDPDRIRALAKVSEEQAEQLRETLEQSISADVSSVVEQTRGNAD